jgi:hypothetical protein
MLLNVDKIKKQMELGMAKDRKVMDKLHLFTGVIIDSINPSHLHLSLLLMLQPLQKPIINKTPPPLAFFVIHISLFAPCIQL